MSRFLAVVGGSWLAFTVLDFTYGAFGGSAEPSLGLPYALGKALFNP